MPGPGLAVAEARGADAATSDAATLNDVRRWNGAIARLMEESGDSDVIRELCCLLRTSIEFDAVRIAPPDSGGDTPGDIYVLDGPDEAVWTVRCVNRRHLPTLAPEVLGFAFVRGGNLVQQFDLCRYLGRASFTARDRDTLSIMEPLLALLLQRKWSVGDAAGSADAGSVDSRLLKLRDRFPISARECEVVRFIVKGHSNYSISSHLDITVGTVKIHRKNIYRKLGISSPSELFSLVFAG